jgi:hypothetical protein
VTFTQLLRPGTAGLGDRVRPKQAKTRLHRSPCGPACDQRRPEWFRSTHRCQSVVGWHMRYLAVTHKHHSSWKRPCAQNADERRAETAVMSHASYGETT